MVSFYSFIVSLFTIILQILANTSCLYFSCKRFDELSTSFKQALKCICALLKVYEWQEKPAIRRGHGNLLTDVVSI